MQKKKLTYKIRLKKNVINKNVFDREVALCKMLSKKQGGRCSWGKRQDCGVIPLLIKRYKGKLLEEPAEIRKAKSKIIKI